ncbi:hypothetical protein PABG_06498 [Paracoccidioides brasiliensis Pb03]|nr:hypothetical protein PABG_06498 [Paracoccidioides brasiliensis Pb03]
MPDSFLTKAASPPGISPSPSTSSNRSGNSRPNVDKNNFKPNIPSFQPTQLISLPSLNSSLVNKSRNDDSAFAPKPYPKPLETVYTPHPNVTIEPVRTGHVSSLMRITGLLLPVRYPNSFYTATITDPIVASLSRVAIYHYHPATDVAAITFSTTAKASPLPASDTVIGGIRCRLEPQPVTADPSPTNPEAQSTNLYIQTLHLLSPYRGRGIAASLLESLIYDPSVTPGMSPRSVSPIVRHYNIRTVTAHVHETNEEALVWYAARGFAIQEGVVEGYYRRLKPGGAKIVKLDLAWNEEGESSKRDPVDGSERINESDDDWEKVKLDEGDSATPSEQFEDYDTLELDECV